MAQDPRNYVNSFDDSFADPNPLDALPTDQTLPESTSIDRDNKLLSFHLPTFGYSLLDYSLRRTSISLTAQLHGMFFMAESPSAVAVDANISPAELTCYRRNLFQITGSITLPRMLRYIMTDQGDRIPIHGQELSISATESVEGHPVKLISVPWKTPATNTVISPEDKAEKEPSSIPLDILSNQDMDTDYATFPIAWKRLQFRIATANNGRRKELQQHFVVRLRVMATLATGAKVSICEAKSGAIIVRGRSPRNFQQKTTYPVGVAANKDRKGMHPPAVSRKPTAETGAQPSPTKMETSPGQAFPSFDFDRNENTSRGNVGDWHHTSSQGARPVPASAASNFTISASPTGARTYSRSGSHSKSPPSAPEVLSLMDDIESNRQRSRTHKAARKSSSTTVTGPFPYKHPTVAFLNTQSHSGLADGLDSADLLYEYIPLGLDDWLPPVDAVYRPHVVHHMNLAQTASAGGRSGLTGRSKRYFSEDQS